MGAADPAPGGASRRRADPGQGRQVARRRADDRHPHRRCSASSQAQAVLLATGGGPTMYRYHTPSGDKSMDGLAMALRAGPAAARHGDGAVPPDRAARRPRHAHDRHRAGGRPARRRRASAQRRRCSASWRDYDPQARARHARRRQSRAMYAEMRAGRTTPHGGVYIKMGHLGPEKVAKQFKGMVERCADCGFDLAGGLVEVVPTAHYFMGGVVCGVDTVDRDAGPVRGRRGRQRHARRQPARRQRRRQLDRVRRHRRRDDGRTGSRPIRGHRAPDEDALEAEMARAQHPFARKGGDLNASARAAARHHVGRRRRDARCGRACSVACSKLDAIEARTAGDRRAGWRPRLQSHLARLAQPALAGGDQPR